MYICSGCRLRQLDSKCVVVFTDGCRSGLLNSSVSRDRQIGHSIHSDPGKGPCFSALPTQGYNALELPSLYGVEYYHDTPDCLRMKYDVFGIYISHYTLLVILASSDLLDSRLTLLMIFFPASCKSEIWQAQAKKSTPMAGNVSDDASDFSGDLAIKLARFLGVARQLAWASWLAMNTHWPRC